MGETCYDPIHPIVTDSTVYFNSTLFLCLVTEISSPISISLVYIILSKKSFHPFLSALTHLHYIPIIIITVIIIIVRQIIHFLHLF